MMSVIQSLYGLAAAWGQSSHWYTHQPIEAQASFLCNQKLPVLCFAVVVV